MKKLIIIAAILILFPAVSMAASAELVRVIDGDIIVAKINIGEITLRLAGIDCPEIKQPGGPEAKAYVEKSLSRGKFRYSSKGKDKYLRALATITTLKGRNLNISLVQKGHAWAHPKATTKIIKGEEKKARKAKVGIWAGTPQAPWKYRIGKESASVPSVLKGLKLSSTPKKNAAASVAGTTPAKYATAADYTISRNIEENNGIVSISGRVSNGPACDNLTIRVSGVSTKGGYVRIVDVIKVSETGSSLYSGQKKGRDGHKEWTISNIYATCTD